MKTRDRQAASLAKSGLPVRPQAEHHEKPVAQACAGKLRGAGEPVTILSIFSFRIIR
jgi:hypothetical protein